MITVPVSAGAYQSVVASIQQSGGITFHSSEGLTGGSNNTIQLISTPLQLANGQIIAKVEQPAEQEATSRQSIQNLVTKVMGQQSIHSNASAQDVKPATLTITPVGSSTSATSANTSSSSVIQMVGGGNAPTRLMRSAVRHVGSEQADQPDTTESLD